MKSVEHFRANTRPQQLRFNRTGIVIIYFICAAQWTIPVDAAFVDVAAAGVAVEDKVTLPSRNEATNPLKEPTPSTLQGTFLQGSNLTDASNGSTSTPPAEASVTFSTVAAAVAETVWNVRTAAVATLPADHRNESATAAKPDSATTNRPLESWQNVVHTSTELQSITPPPKPATDGPSTEGMASGGDYGPDVDNTNLMANMLKSWFNNKDDSAAATVAKGFYNLQYLKNKNSEKEGGRKDGGPSKVGVSSSKTATVDAATVGGNNKSLFERWDEASEEQERVLEDAMRSERPADDSGGDGGGGSSVLAADQNTPSRWFVLLLSGNSTVAQMRRTDFAKYLKLNLAARLSLEYDEVKINRVLVVPPRLMVNVSVVPVSERASAIARAAAAEDSGASSSSSSASSSRSSLISETAAVAVSDRVVEDDDPLHNLVETNATLMELSGEEYRVERFMSLKSQKPQSMEETVAVVSNRHADIDFFIYATVGPLCFVVVIGFLLLTLYKYVRKHPVQWPWKRKFRHPSFWPGGRSGGAHQHRHRRMTDECGGGRDGGCGMSSAEEAGGSAVNVIYSGEFEQSQQQQLSGSWLDDASFVPDDSLDRIRTPTLLRTVAQPPPQPPPPPPPQPQPPAVKNKTFTDMLQQCSNGDGSDAIIDVHRYHSFRMGLGTSAPIASASYLLVGGDYSPRLSRDNKLRILGCKQSCLLLPAVQPAAADNNNVLTTAATTTTTTTTATSTQPPPPSQPTDAVIAAAPENDRGQP